MPAPELPDSDGLPKRPNPIPDMSLGERTDKVHPASESAHVVPAQSLPKVAESLQPSDAIPTSGWKERDRVLAPWEPDLLYLGSVGKIQGTQAFIEYEDGGSGWVLVTQLQPFVLKRGQRVFARRHHSMQRFAGEILDVRKDEVSISFDDGEPNAWISLSEICIPCEPKGPPAEAVSVPPVELPVMEDVQVGDRVWAPWMSATLFVGTVAEIRAQEVHIRFDDGDSGWVQLTQLVPLEIAIGMAVLGRWQMGNTYYPGDITAVQGNRVHIHYQDGDREWTTLAALALPCQPRGPDARPTTSAFSLGPALNWILPLGIGIMLALLRGGCGS